MAEMTVSMTKKQLEEYGLDIAKDIFHNTAESLRSLAGHVGELKADEALIQVADEIEKSLKERLEKIK